MKTGEKFCPKKFQDKIEEKNIENGEKYKYVNNREIEVEIYPEKSGFFRYKKVKIYFFG